jgi:hypothetical protein
MNLDEYVNGVGSRLAADGAEVFQASIGGLNSLVGHRSEFRMSWMATRLHLFTIVSVVPVVTARALDQFANDALDYAISQRGQLRGLQSGVAAIPVLVGERVEPEAAAFARDTLVRRYAAMAWPAAVDMTSRHVHTHQGSVLVGVIYAGWLRQQTALALRDPTGT